MNKKDKKTLLTIIIIIVAILIISKYSDFLGVYFFGQEEIKYYYFDDHTITGIFKPGIGIFYSEVYEGSEFRIYNYMDKDPGELNHFLNVKFYDYGVITEENIAVTDGDYIEPESTFIFTNINLFNHQISEVRFVSTFIWLRAEDTCYPVFEVGLTDGNRFEKIYDYTQTSESYESFRHMKIAYDGEYYIYSDSNGHSSGHRADWIEEDIGTGMVYMKFFTEEECNARAFYQDDKITLWDADINVDAIDYTIDSCFLAPGQYLAQQTFGPGAIITTASLPNFVNYCTELSTEVLDASSNTVSQVYDVLLSLEAGQTVNVPVDKAYNIKWISSNPNAECAEGQTFSIGPNICLDTGIVYYGETITTVVQECVYDADCTTPCIGMSTTCNINTCEYTGYCIAQPSQGGVGANIWNLISNVWTDFWNRVLNIFDLGTVPPPDPEPEPDPDPDPIISYNPEVYLDYTENCNEQYFDSDGVGGIGGDNPELYGEVWKCVGDNCFKAYGDICADGSILKEYYVTTTTSACGIYPKQVDPTYNQVNCLNGCLDGECK